jgi:benzoylformate decarboxylase
MATMPPAGPVFLSIPLDDFDKEIDAEPYIRQVSTITAPDPTMLAQFADRISKSEKLALVYGEEVDQSLGWEAGIALAELLKAPVFQAPLASRAVFPFNNPLYQGSLPLAQGPVGEALANFDTVLVVGAEVFRYYPYVNGPVVQNGTQLMQITNSPHDAGAARVGDALLSDARLALESLYLLLRKNQTSTATSTSSTHAPSASSSASTKSLPKNNGSSLMTAAEAFQAAALGRQKSDLLVQESPSNVEDLLKAWPIVEQSTYYTSASDYLGWGLPAAVGIALAQTNRTTVLALGDGSMQYSVQAIYSAVQHKAKLIILVPQNNEYAILKEFAIFEKAPNCRKYPEA